jgi:hypothetical protein
MAHATRICYYYIDLAEFSAHAEGPRQQWVIYLRQKCTSHWITPTFPILTVHFVSNACKKLPPLSMAVHAELALLMHS